MRLSAPTPQVRPVFRWALVVVLILLVPYVGWSSWDYFETRALDAAIADARFRTSIRPPRAPAKNEFADDPVRFYRAAQELIPYRPELRILDRAFRALDQPPSAEQIAAADTILKESAPAFDLVFRAQGATVRSWRLQGSNSVLYGLSTLVSLLSFRTHVLARTARMDEAVQSLLDQLATLRVFEGLEPTDRSGFYPNHVLNISGADLEWLLRLAPLPPERLSLLARAFSIDVTDDPSVTIFPLRSILDGNWPRTQNALVRPLHRRQLRRILRESMEVFEASRRPWPQRLRGLETLEASATDDPMPPLSTTEKKFVASAVASTRGVARSLARARSLTVAVAVEQYRQATGRLPGTLDELTPRYLAAVPIDPFSGAPLLYRQDSSGYRVYGVGINGKDDGGDFGGFAWDAALRNGPDAGVRITR